MARNNPKTKVAADDTGENDAQAKFEKEVRGRAGKTKKILMYLESVALGECKDQILTKGGELIERDVPHQVRVQASRTWKEMVLDKQMPDRRDATPKRGGKAKVSDEHRAALEGVAKKKSKKREEEGFHGNA